MSPPSDDVMETHRKLEEIQAYIASLKSVFNARPGMLGTPYEVNAMFFFIDAIDAIVSDHVGTSHLEASWINFLIEKKWIVGADDRLKTRLKADDWNFMELQALRTDFYAWRKERVGY